MLAFASLLLAVSAGLAPPAWPQAAIYERPEEDRLYYEPEHFVRYRMGDAGPQREDLLPLLSRQHAVIVLENPDDYSERRLYSTRYVEPRLSTDVVDEPRNHDDVFLGLRLRRLDDRNRSLDNGFGRSRGTLRLRSLCRSRYYIGNGGWLITVREHRGSERDAHDDNQPADKSDHPRPARRRNGERSNSFLRNLPSRIVRRRVLRYTLRLLFTDG